MFKEILKNSKFRLVILSGSLAVASVFIPQFSTFLGSAKAIIDAKINADENESNSLEQLVFNRFGCSHQSVPLK